MSMTLITSKDPRGLHFVGLCEVTYNKSKLDEGRAQRLNENGGEFQAGLKKLIEQFSLASQFANEEVASNYRYPAEYIAPQPIDEQIKAIAKIFNLDEKPALNYIKNLPALPDGAEGWFAIPHWEKIVPTYGEAVEKVISLLAACRGVYNYRADQLGERHLRQHPRTVEMLQKLGDQQNDSDILIVPVQFGLRHRGRSVRRAREVFAENEFGLGAFAVGCMLLTHPEREVRWEQLHVDCPGDEYDFPGYADRWAGAPIFCFFGGFELWFYAGLIGGARPRYGSASGFLPQS